jgi:multidrug transporter EmrE-like cation transporter
MSFMWIVVTAALWGCTDPLLKHFGKARRPSRGQDKGILSETISFFGDWRYSLTFLANQLGSLTFIFALVNSDVTVAVPVTNGLKFLFNFAVGQLVLNESKLSLRSWTGIIFLACGIILQSL